MINVVNNLDNGASSFSKNGVWFTDAESRYLIFRGVNFASRSKLPPYLPIAPLHENTIDQSILSEEIELVRSELDLLKRLGFNVVRLLVSWKSIELKPKPNPNPDELSIEGQQYLSYVPGKSIILS